MRATQASTANPPPVGGGWFVRGAVDLAVIHAVVLVRPDVAAWFWAVVLGARVLTVLLRTVRGPADLSLLLLDMVLVAGVLAWLPVTAAVLLLPLLAWTFAAIVDGDRARALVVVPVAALAGTLVLRVALTTTLVQHGIVVGGLVAVVVAWIAGAQSRARATGLSHAVGRLRSRNDRLLQATSEAIFLTDDRSTMLEGNEEAHALHGGGDGSFRGAPCSSLRLQQGLRPLDCSTGCALLAAGTEGQDHEVWQGEAGTERRHLLARVTPVLDRRGKVAEVLHAMRDISSIRRAEEGQTLFLATASHELKTPLTVIGGFTSLMRDNDALTDDQRRSMLTTIMDRTGELTTIVERLLITGRVGAGMVDLSIAPTSAVDVVEDRVRAIGQVSERHDLVFTAVPDVPSVQADPEALNVVVDHLLENAVKYSPGGGSIAVGVATTDHDVLVTVTDDGIGMKPGDAARCFDRFWQGDVGERRRFGGTGVGLYIVQELVHGMGGEIHATSVLDQGTTFHLTLRRADAAVVAHPDDGDGDDDTTGGMVDSVMAAVGL